MKTKRKFNILSILLLIAFFASNIAECIHDFNYDQSSFDEVEKVDSGYDSPRRQIYYYNCFNVRPNHRFDIAARNTKTGKIDSLQIIAVQAKVTGTGEINKRFSTSTIAGLFVFLPLLLCGLYFLYTFICLVLSVNKGEGFSKNTTHRLKVLGWLCLILFCLEIAGTLLINYENGLVDYAQYPISGTCDVFPDFILLILFFAFLLFAQFFELGQKMKEEQDLTI